MNTLFNWETVYQSEQEQSYLDMNVRNGRTAGDKWNEKAYGTDSAWKQLLEQEKKRIGLNTDQLFYVNQIKLKLQVLKEHTLQQESTKNITHLFFSKKVVLSGYHQQAYAAQPFETLCLWILKWASF